MDRDHDRQVREAPRPLAGVRSNAALYTTSLSDAVKRGQSTLDRARPRVTASADKDALEAIGAALTEIEASGQAYEVAVATWLAAEEAETGGDKGRAVLELDRSRQHISLIGGNLSALVEGRIQRVSERTLRAQRRAQAVSGALAGLAVVFAALMGAVALVTLRPIEQLTAQVQRLASGDQVGPIAVRSTDEVGVLAAEFNKMAAAVHERDRRLSERAAALDALSLRLRQVLDTIHAGLVVIEAERAATTNPAAERLWGLQPGAALPEWLGGLGEGRHASVAVGGRLFDLDVAPFGESGRLVVGEDVTDITHERDRAARNERLALVGQMLAQVTHEVRNPLNAISLNAELLGDELPADSEAVAMLSTISSEIRRLEAVTARYLDLSRRRSPELNPEDPMALVRGVARLEEEGLRREGVVVEVCGAPTATVELDGDALRRALRNLLRNAVEAGARHIRFDVALTTSPAMLEVVVEDDGPGLGDGEEHAAFEPFYTTKAKGTGLGLAISRQELEDVGGTLTSEPKEKGARFILGLPVIARS
jgi:signal transduction histidine kinase/HAMP domain-containing protein